MRLSHTQQPRHSSAIQIQSTRQFRSISKNVFKQIKKWMLHTLLLLHSRCDANNTNRTKVLLEYDEPTERCIYLYIIIFFFSILNTRGKKSEYILLPLVGCFAVNVNMWNREKKKIKSISHMEFMRFYVNCGTRLEYYMRSHLWHRYNNIHGLTQWNNTREGAP